VMREKYMLTQKATRGWAVLIRKRREGQGQGRKGAPGEGNYGGGLMCGGKDKKTWRGIRLIGDKNHPRKRETPWWRFKKNAGFGTGKRIGEDNAF